MKGPFSKYVQTKDRWCWTLIEKQLETLSLVVDVTTISIWVNCYPRGSSQWDEFSSISFTNKKKYLF